MPILFVLSLSWFHFWPSYITFDLVGKIWGWVSSLNCLLQEGSGSSEKKPSQLVIESEKICALIWTNISDFVTIMHVNSIMHFLEVPLENLLSQKDCSNWTTLSYCVIKVLYFIYKFCISIPAAYVFHKWPLLHTVLQRLLTAWLGDC